MKIAVIDDLATCRQELQGCLRRYFSEQYEGDPCSVEEFASAEDFLCRFVPQSFDLIFIDQYMTGLTGMDTAKRIREQDTLVVLIFVTTSREHAVDSYGVKAGGYLVKPYTYEDFASTMKLTGIEKLRNARFITVEQEKILLREILWCNQDVHYAQVHTEKRGILRFRIPFSELAALLLPYPEFLTCYKGCVLNMERVDYFDKLNFFLDTGGRVPFSLRDSKKIEAMYHTYLFQREREEELT